MKNALFLTLIFVWHMPGASPAQESQLCQVEIQKPQNGDMVGGKEEVRGTANVPSGMFLWIFAHRRGLAKWWPQGGGSISVEDHQWVVLATLGDESDPQKDANQPFEIIAVVVDQKNHREIAKYVEESERKNYYPGMPLPPTDAGCTSKKRVVSRNSK